MKINDYSGILVYIQSDKNKINDISFEMLNIAKDLSNKLNEKIYAVNVGNENLVKNLLDYDIDVIYNYGKDFKEFNSESFTYNINDCIKRCKPSIVLIGATNEGRSIIPRLAVLNKSGMTADCVDLKIENGNLLQIRPAFGGKVMAEILTEQSRPQFASIRKGISKSAIKGNFIPKIINCEFIEKTNIELISKIIEEKQDDITKAEILVCIGNGVKTKEQVNLFKEFTDKIGGSLCASRLLIEKGLLPADKQVGLSGKAVAPKLMIIFGVSGSIQFLAGIKNCKNIIAVNSDENANILKVANYSIVCDMFELINNLKK